MTGAPEETVGHQLGTIAKLIIWLVGIMAALQFLNLGQILSPINELVTEIFGFLPKLIAAGLIFFVGLVVARIVRRLVETVLIAANIDGLLARVGIGSTEGTVRTPPEAVPPGAAPATTRASLAKAGGILVFALIIIPVAIAALQALGISSISGPATDMLNQILTAIPRIIAAALWLGIAFIAARFLKSIIEAVLPPTGFDDALRSTGLLPPNAIPSRIVPNIAMIVVILAASIEAARQLGGARSPFSPRKSPHLAARGTLGTLIIFAAFSPPGVVPNLVGSGPVRGGFAPTPPPSATTP